MPEAAFQQTTNLVRAAQDGSREALEQLFARYLPRVRRIVAARLGQPLASLAEDEDLVQESLLEAFNTVAAHGLTSEGAFRSWLARCVQNNVFDAHRRRQREAGRVQPLGGATTSGALGVFASGATPSESLRERELEPRLEQALLGLRPEHREVVVLRVLCEMSFREIADAMNLEQEATARQWFARALRKMRESVA